jgi:hypothetical protein
MLISGMGFFTDAYDLFVIGVVMAILKPLWQVTALESSLVTSTALLALLHSDEWRTCSGEREFMVWKCLSWRRGPSDAHWLQTFGG